MSEKNYPKYRDRHLRWATDCIDEDDNAIHVAKQDGTFVGYVFVLPELLAKIRDAAVLNELFVIGQVRGIGVSEQLMEAVFTTASAQNFFMDRIVLDVDEERFVARTRSCNSSEENAR